MSMDISDVLTDDDFLDDFQLVKWVSGIRTVDGDWVNTYAPPVTLRESIQPGTSDELRFLPEGERDKRSCVVYSKTPISKGDGQNTDSDQIAWQGQTYRVVFSQHWEAYGYYFVIATLLAPFTA